MLNPFKIHLIVPNIRQQKRLITKVPWKDLLRIIHFGVHHLIVPFFWGNFLNFLSLFGTLCRSKKKIGNGMKTATIESANKTKKEHKKLEWSRNKLKWYSLVFFFCFKLRAETIQNIGDDMMKTRIPTKKENPNNEWGMRKKELVQ